MDMPRFTAEASLCKTSAHYRGKAVYGNSGAAGVLPMLPRRPTISHPGDCFNDPTTDKECSEGGGLLCYCCYADGCWICDNLFEIPANCVWDDSYRARIGRGIGRIARVAAPIVG
ncbi:hypothetical protein sS8_1848 [Methylocaldum marinum]|uniref:Uncharacterized protein n=1 Tax=Methylocaldum marinum TaxID=1432792 RepID=A0A250KQI7_9GAMM|nr:hypothetical protein sS8_1848 [Methylocaldum marinum]